MRLTSLPTALAAALALSACGSQDMPVRHGPIGGETGEELAEVQILRRGNGTEPQTLDPHRAEGVPSSNILRDLFEGLVGEAPDGTLIPGAAESWEISADGLTYTFTLRPGGRWSNGDPVTAQDFEYGLRRSVDPETLSRYSSVLAPIRNARPVIAGELPPEELGVVAVDDRTLVIELESPTPYFLGLLTHSTCYAVHPPTVEAHGANWARAETHVGNGAYRLKDWVVQSHIDLTRNVHYWDNANTTIDDVRYYPIENQDAELKRYRADELDITSTIPLKQLRWIRENLADEFRITPYLGTYYFGFNVTKPPFAGQTGLRRAMSLAVDREIITGIVSGSGELPAFSWVPPVRGYQQQIPEEAFWTQEQREAEARRLYAEAGYSRDNPLVVEVIYNTSDNHKRIAIALAFMWKQVLGVEASLSNQEWKVFLETRKRKEDTQLYRAGWIGDYEDAYTFAQLLESTNEQNDFGYNNPRYDALLAVASAEPDIALRAEHLQEAERVLLADQPLMPLYFYVTKRMVKPWVQGYDGNIMDHVYTRHMRILKH
ncbi:peptide ABC transporter substrate-binding protein [Candidatus Foliamicus sp.]